MKRLTNFNRCCYEISMQCTSLSRRTLFMWHHSHVTTGQTKWLLQCYFPPLQDRLLGLKISYCVNTQCEELWRQCFSANISHNLSLPTLVLHDLNTAIFSLLWWCYRLHRPCYISAIFRLSHVYKSYVLRNIQVIQELLKWYKRYSSYTAT